MTPTDLDRIAAAVERCAAATPVQREQWDQLIALARLGLRREAETCGRCEHREASITGKGHYCYMASNKVKDADFCSSWRAKEEVKP